MDNLSLRQFRRRGGGWFVEAEKSRNLNELKAAIVAYEQDPFNQDRRNHLRSIRMVCVVRYTTEEVQSATIDAYRSHLGI